MSSIRAASARQTRCPTLKRTDQRFVICSMGGLTYAHAVIFSWLDHVLCGKPMPPEHDPAAAERFVGVFRRHAEQQGETKARALLEVASLV